MTGMERVVSSEPHHVYFCDPEIHGDQDETNADNPERQDTGPSPGPVRRILFVDDERQLCKIFKKALEKFGYEVRVAFDGNEGLKRFREIPADLVITDLFMPEKDGHTFISDIMQAFPGTRIFAVTGYKTCFGLDMELEIAKTLGAERVFAKPVRIMELLQAIKDLGES